MEPVTKKDDVDNKEEVIQKIKELPAKDRVRAIALNHHLQLKKGLDAELEVKIEEAQQSFDLRAIPYYNAQNELALGTRPVTEEELEGIGQFLSDEEKSQYKEFANEPLVDYWPRILKTYFAGTTQISDKDFEVLQHLQKVEFTLHPPKHDFSIIFTFKENEYFDNTVLTKKFIYSDDIKEADYPKSSEGTHIHWKEGKNVTVKQVEKKQKNKKTGQSRTVKKTVKAESFFNLFGTIQTTEGDDDVSHLSNLKLAEQMDQDIDIAKDFVEQIFPTQLSLYLGIKEDNDDEFEDIDDEDGEDDDEKDEDDSDDDKKKKKKKEKAPKKAEAEPKDEKPKEGGECKQQ